MSTHHQDEIDQLTAEAHHAHATSLQREVGQLRIVKEGLRARVKDLEARVADLQQAMGHPGKRIADLQQRLERAVDANVTLRQENARLRVENAGLHEQQVYDQREQMERALRLEAERL